MSTKKYCSKSSEIPNTSHYAIVQTTSVYTPGDQRSRINPGHGYPARTEYHVIYISYTDKVEWENAVIDLSNRNEVFKALIVQIPVIERVTKVTIK